MKIIKVKDPNKIYNIVIGDSIIQEIGKFIDFKKYSKIFLLTEKKIINLWQIYIQDNLPSKTIFFEIKSGEYQKNISNVEKISKKMLEAGLDRKSLLINFGGGMISDLGGFCASIYMRGIDFINIPTTLLSMVDASIGGKVAVNLGNIKNIIGTFNSPVLVFIDLKFLETLKLREKISANSEIIKHAIIKDLDFFSFIKKNKINLSNKSKLIETIEKSSIIKKAIVEADFKEENIRKILNFGHTIGHAIETLAMREKKKILHGEAVAIGMLIEAKIANSIGLMSKEEYSSIYEILEKNGFRKILKTKIDLPVDEVIKIIKMDKKNEDQKIYLCLPEKIGKCKEKIEIKSDKIKEIILEFFYS